MTGWSEGSVAKFIFSYGVGCRKKVLSQWCKMQKNEILIFGYKLIVVVKILLWMRLLEITLILDQKVL